MQIPSVQEMMDAMASPVVPPDADTEDRTNQTAADMSLQTELLLDVVKSIERLSVKIDSIGRPAPTTPDPNLYGVTSNQLEF